ncbi:MAG: hypothetical protein Fur0037_08340 [Planctomycetota bacterium]
MDSRRSPIFILSLAAAVAALVLVGRWLPLREWLEQAGDLRSGNELAAAAVFASIYVAATMLFVPGAALTLVAAPLFGMFEGVVLVSIASTTSAALSFLAARKLLRRRVEALAARYPRLSAVDAAIGDGTFRAVALLRLVPLFPFSSGNYLLGLTRARYWPYVLASWLFMLPGTILYVYAGLVGAEVLEAEGNPANRWRTALFVAGLLAAFAAAAATRPADHTHYTTGTRA